LRVSDASRAKKRRIMRITLERAVSPEYMEEQDCGMCGVRFTPEAVIAWDEHARPVCLHCVWYLGWRNPERFPTIADYKAAVERYPEPVFPSVEVILDLEEKDPHAVEKVMAVSAVG
jgi:hypothetical protein